MGAPCWRGSAWPRSRSWPDVLGDEHASPYYRLAGFLLGAIALLVVGYAVLERDVRVPDRVYLSSGRLGPAAYLVPTPAR
jgi:hypothetical protein